MSLFIAPRVISTISDGRSSSAHMSRDVSMAELSRMTGEVRQWRDILNPKILEELQKTDHDETFCGYFKRLYDAFGLRHIIPVLILVAYSFGGAAIVFHFEYPNEVEERVRDKQITDNSREQLIRNLTQIMFVGDSASFVSETQINETRRLLITYDQADTKYVNVSQTKWDFWSALFFTGTIYTTIGYGNLSPKTFGGRIFTIFYAIVGIPLLLAILNDLGDILYRYSGLLYRRLKRKRKDKVAPDPLKVDSNLNAETEVDIEEDKDIPMWLAIAITVAWLFISSAFFLVMQTDWNYFQSFYFFFISFSTIGLGDLVPDNPQYMVINFWLVLIGLSLVSMTISIIQSKIEEFLFRVMKRIREEYNKLIGAVEDKDEEFGGGDLTETQKHQVMQKVWNDQVFVHIYDIIQPIYATMLHCSYKCFQPWYVKSLLPKVLNERQREVLKEHNEVVAFVVTHSKKIQTDFDSNWIDRSFESGVHMNDGYHKNRNCLDVCIQVAFQEDELMELQIEQCPVGTQTAQLDFVSQICQTDTLATFKEEIQTQTEPIGMRDECEQTGRFVGGILRNPSSLSRRSDFSRVSFISDVDSQQSANNEYSAAKDVDNVSWSSASSAPVKFQVDRGLKRQTAINRGDSNESLPEPKLSAVGRAIVGMSFGAQLGFPFYTSVYKSKSLPMASIAENGKFKFTNDSMNSTDECQPLMSTVTTECETTSTDDIFVDAESDLPLINLIPDLTPMDTVVEPLNGMLGDNNNLSAKQPDHYRKLSNGNLIFTVTDDDNCRLIELDSNETNVDLQVPVRKVSNAGRERKTSQQLRKPNLLEVDGHLEVINFEPMSEATGAEQLPLLQAPVRKLSRSIDRRSSSSYRINVITDDMGVQTDSPRDLGLMKDQSVDGTNEISDRSSQTEEKSVREMCTNTVKEKKKSFDQLVAVRFDIDIQTDPVVVDTTDRCCQTKDSWLRIASRINSFQTNRAPSLMISRAPMVKRSLPEPILPQVVVEEEEESDL